MWKLWPSQDGMMPQIGAQLLIPANLTDPRWQSFMQWVSEQTCAYWKEKINMQNIEHVLWTKRASIEGQKLSTMYIEYIHVWSKKVGHEIRMKDAWWSKLEHILIRR